MLPTFGKDDTINRMQRKDDAMPHVALRRPQVDLERHCALVGHNHQVRYREA